MSTNAPSETWTNANPRLAAKAIKCATLAVGEYGVGNEDAGDAAAFRAGELTHAAGFTLDQLANEVPAIVGTGNCWSFAVDGWYGSDGASS